MTRTVSRRRSGGKDGVDPRRRFGASGGGILAGISPVPDFLFAIPAKAGIDPRRRQCRKDGRWIPAFAGMTKETNSVR